MKSTKYLFLSLLVLLFSSCFNDKGSYDYIDINEVEISGLGSYSRIYKIDTLRITPEITYTQDNSELRYEYEWTAKIVSDANTEPEAIFMGNIKNLEYHVKLDLASYNIYLKVK